MRKIVELLACTVALLVLAGWRGGSPLDVILHAPMHHSSEPGRIPLRSIHPFRQGNQAFQNVLTSLLMLVLKVTILESDPRKGTSCQEIRTKKG